MAPNVRDNFSIRVQDTLAKRVGLRCSRPGCPQHTSGPRSDPTRALNVGVAAHITAASPGGPRYDPALTTAQRRSAENGVWLCQTCAKLIDNDAPRYSATLLREWKKAAEDLALARIEVGQAAADRPVVTLTPRPDNWPIYIDSPEERNGRFRVQLEFGLVVAGADIELLSVASTFSTAKGPCLHQEPLLWLDRQQFYFNADWVYLATPPQLQSRRTHNLLFQRQLRPPHVSDWPDDIETGTALLDLECRPLDVPMSFHFKFFYRFERGRLVAEPLPLLNG